MERAVPLHGRSDFNKVLRGRHFGCAGVRSGGRNKHAGVGQRRLAAKSRNSRVKGPEWRHVSSGPAKNWAVGGGKDGFVCDGLTRIGQSNGQAVLAQPMAEPLPAIRLTKVVD